VRKNNQAAIASYNRYWALAGRQSNANKRVPEWIKDISKGAGSAPKQKGKGK
jgi:hypothetical protein